MVESACSLPDRRMNSSIIGTGTVGSALADGFTAAGHGVVLGSRSPDVSEHSGVEITTQWDAAERGDFVALALLAGVVVDDEWHEKLFR